MTTAPGYAECAVELRHASLGRSAWLTFGANPTGTDVDVMNVNISSAINESGSLRTILDNAVTVREVTVRYGIDGADDVVVTNVYALTGASAMSSLPPNCCALVAKRTGRGGRRGRGRLYIPWCVATTDVTEDGLLTAGRTTTLQNAMTTFLGALAANDMPMVILHRPSLPSTIHPTAQGNPDPVTGLIVDPIIGTQRRRLGR